MVVFPPHRRSLTSRTNVFGTPLAKKHAHLRGICFRERVIGYYCSEFARIPDMRVASIIPEPPLTPGPERLQSAQTLAEKVSRVEAGVGPRSATARLSVLPNDEGPFVHPLIFGRSLV